MKTLLSILLLLVMGLSGTVAEARDRGRSRDDGIRDYVSDSYDFRTDYRRRHRSDEDSDRGGRSGGERVSRDDAARIAGKHFKGRVLGVKRDDGTWRVKMLNSKGEVRILAVDDETGEIVSPR